MFNVKWSALASLFLLPSAYAAAHCPGNAASVHARNLAQHLNLVEVSVNRRGPWLFLLDTGAQITSIDPALAAELQLKARVAGQVFGVTSNSAVPFAELDDVAVNNASLIPWSRFSL